MVHLTVRFNVSERWTCRVVGQHRSTHRLAAPPAASDELAVRLRLREISASFPRFGYRMACAIVRGEGHRVNLKRVQRLWRDDGGGDPVSCLNRLGLRRYRRWATGVPGIRGLQAAQAG